MTTHRSGLVMTLILYTHHVHDELDENMLQEMESLVIISPSAYIAFIQRILSIPINAFQSG
jgi:hypothetical protein